MAKTGASKASIVFGSITICCSSCSLFYALYIVIALGSALSGLLGGILAGISLDNVLMIIAGSLAIAAAKQVVNKKLWVAAVVISALSSVLYLAAFIFLVQYGEQNFDQNPFSGTKMAGVVINLCIQVGLLVSVSVGLHLVESQKRRRQQAQQPSLEAQMLPTYSKQQDEHVPLPHMEPPPLFKEKPMIDA